MLNWIVWNGTVFDIETELFNIELFWHLTARKQNLYLYKTELAELELFDKTELFEIEIFLTIELCTKLNCFK